jgi:hypothetical protein
MDKLEKFITDNVDAFDDNEPESGHFERFQGKLDQQYGYNGFSFDRNLFLKIAAGIIILMTVSVFVFDYTANRISKSFSSENSVVKSSSEMQDAINYYDAAASTKLGQINKLACCGQDTRKIISMATDEMKSLNANSTELRKALAENPGDERIQAAIIQNHQMKEKVMNQFVNQMKRE